VGIGKKIEAVMVFVCTATFNVMAKLGEFAFEGRSAWRAPEPPAAHCHQCRR